MAKKKDRWVLKARGIPTGGTRITARPFGTDILRITAEIKQDFKQKYNLKFYIENRNFLGFTLAEMVLISTSMRPLINKAVQLMKEKK